MNKPSILGIIIAIVLLMLALLGKAMGAEKTVDVMLPVLFAAAAALTAIDIAAYRKNNDKARISKGTELVRIISLAVVTVLLLAALIINIVF